MVKILSKGLNPPVSNRTQLNTQQSFQFSAKSPPNNALPAVFMIIEHIETDKCYTSQLRGRRIMTNSIPLECTQVYEFTTFSANFTVYVVTPDDIDMF
jgi:hypothetical protein